MKMFGTYVCAFVLILFFFYSLSFFFMKRKGYYGIWTQTVAQERAWRKARIVSAGATFPFAAIVVVLVFVTREDTKAWLSLAAVIIWTITMLIVVTTVLRREMKVKK
jgi:succinate dehydrogenase hydrophobic anchor subunit